MKKSRLIVAFIAVILAVNLHLSADEHMGSICISPLPENAKNQDYDMRDGKPQRRKPYYKFSVQIDRNDPISIPVNDKPVLVGNLELNTKHIAVIRDKADVIESFWFSFESRNNNDLCLFYKPWYQMWVLDPPKPGQYWCKCDS